MYDDKSTYMPNIVDSCFLKHVMQYKVP